MKADDPKPLQYISEAYKELGDEDKALSTTSSTWIRIQMLLLQTS